MSGRVAAGFHEQWRFRRFAGVIGYDPAHREWCWTQFTVEVASIDSIGERDETLLSDDFFGGRPRGDPPAAGRRARPRGRAAGRSALTT